jgi:hypothetical protein
MNDSDWKTFAANLQGLVMEVDRLLGLFSRNLDSEYTVLLLQLQEDAMAVLANYSIWPDLLGVAEELLPPKLDESSNVQFSQCERSRRNNSSSFKISSR